jgi:hypothetical protein
LFRSYAQTQYYWYLRNGQREQIIEENFRQCAEVCGVPIADFMKELEEWAKTQDIENWGSVRSDKDIEEQKGLADADEDSTPDVFSFSK